MVATGIIGMLMAILVPTLGRARESAHRAVCAVNLRQLYAASIAYASDNRGVLPPAHLDFITKNLHRWHGTREDMNLPFDFAGSVLRKYLQVSAIKQCPGFVFAADGFEASAGGYGYNDRYLGSSIGVPAPPMNIYKYESRYVNQPAKVSMIQRPAQTVMFADVAMASPSLIEYSFVEPPLANGMPTSPSIHFRHLGQANVVWVDGHVSSERMEWTYPQNVYGADNSRHNLGFFGPRDNTLFDRQ
jgi:prepilin-type processing-associated H-X9-DG protein